MKFGICCGPTSLAHEGEDVAASVARLMTFMQEVGADYVEFGVGATLPEGSEADWEALRAAVTNQALRVEAFNSFIPGHHRITGPDVNLQRVLDYCRTALPRCKALGGEVVVLGSAGARKVPAGFSHDEARQQFIRFCRALNPIAEEADITIALEPLNTKEDNFLLSVGDGARLVDEIAQPRIQLLADLYHMAEEKEPMQNVAQAGARLKHTHLADIGRVAPGFATEGEEDFIGFFRAMRTADYDARCSFEGRFDDMSTQVEPALALMKQRWQESAA
ncbi:MAG TPA: sugar phosphate isomerase/epimerase family protein [Abditibacteriaceae bacterium]|jgi:sugar phosphate isomerase/epimerase